MGAPFPRATHQKRNATSLCRAILGRASGSIVVVLFLGAWYSVKPFLDCYRAGAGSKLYVLYRIIEWANARVPPTPLRRHHEDKPLESRKTHQKRGRLRAENGASESGKKKLLAKLWHSHRQRVHGQQASQCPGQPFSKALEQPRQRPGTLCPRFGTCLAHAWQRIADAWQTHTAPQAPAPALAGVGGYRNPYNSF